MDASQKKLRRAAALELKAIAKRHEDYLFGECATLALAMNKISGLPLYAILGFDEALDREVLIHAYVKSGDYCIDIKGPRVFEEVMGDFVFDDAAENAYEWAIKKGALSLLATGARSCPSLTSAMPIAQRVLELSATLVGVPQLQARTRKEAEAAWLQELLAMRPTPQ